MKTIRLVKKNLPTFLLFTLLLCVLAFLSCDTEDDGDFTEEKEEDVRVENVEWKSDLKSGYEVSISDKSLNVANRMDISPENASNQQQTFSSSNPGIATVSEQGQVTPLSLGTTTITVSVDEMSDEFALKVVAEKIINVSSISVSEANLELELNTTVNLASKYTISPMEATNKEVIYSSSEPTIASVSEEGIVEGLKIGATTITVTSVDNPDAKGEFNIEVTEVSFKGDYPREEWTMMSSQDVFDEGSNSLASPLDGDFDTWFGLVKPGKSWKEVSIPDSQGIYFIIDMKEEKTVNYFKIRHRNDSQIFLRYRLIEEVYGSNDGENFTLIASDVPVTDYEQPEPMSPNLSIPESTYRYFKFYCKKEACFDPSRGSTAQLSEFYLGVE